MFLGPPSGPGSAMRHVLVFLFAASGFAGLVYESVWSHYLRILLGAAAYAQSLVLAVFMGGMALGAWTASRKSPRWGNLLRAYALVELALPTRCCSVRSWAGPHRCSWRRRCAGSSGWD